MKRRSFLSLLGLAPAAPLIAKEMAKALPAPQPHDLPKVCADEHIKLIKDTLRRTFPKAAPTSEFWTLQPLDENRQPWMGLAPLDAKCERLEDGFFNLTVVLPQRSEWIGRPMPTYVKACVFGAEVVTCTNEQGNLVPIGTVTIVQRIGLS
jgi:hypothetical protein